MRAGLALALQLGVGEGGVLHDVAQHLHQGGRITGQAAHVEGGVVLVGVGIDLGAQALGIEVTRKTRQAEREQGPAPAAGQRGKLQTRGNPGGGVEAFQRDYAAALLRG